MCICVTLFSRTSVYDSRARERLRQIEEQKALALQLQNQVNKNWEEALMKQHIQVETNLEGYVYLGSKLL